MKRLASAGLMLMLIAGCATYPTDPAQQAQYHVVQAHQELLKGQLDYALTDVVAAIARPTGVAQMRALIHSDVLVKTKMTEGVNAKIDSIIGPEEAKQCAAFLKKIIGAGIFDQTDSATFKARYASVVQNGNESGAIAFLIDGESESIAELADSHHQRIMFERTIGAYRDKSFSRRNLSAVVTYARSSGANAPLLDELRSQLQYLNIRSSELSQIAVIDANFAALRKAQLSMNAHLSIKNADRLFADDVVSRLSQDTHGITWVQAAKPGTLELVIERVRDSEKVLPTESRTVTYSYGQVDILSAALLMPKNASYQFDLKSGGAELEYGYVISAWRDGAKVAESVLRGKLGGSSRKCENPRVINVFGGVSAASFMANDDMRSACSNQGEVSMDSLRTELLAKISAGVIAIPAIGEVNALNL